MIDLAVIKECRGCGGPFVHPLTGPIRPYCSSLCRDVTHATRKLHPLDADGLPGVEREWPAPSPNDSFSGRFRDADPRTLFYETILVNDPCCYCGSRENMQLDHIEAFITGGSGEWTNCTASCRACNSSKCDKPLLWWLLQSPRMLALRYPQLELEGLCA